MQNIKNNIAPVCDGQKLCQFCGTMVLAAYSIVGCVACQRENRIKWLAARPWIAAVKLV